MSQHTLILVLTCFDDDAMLISKRRRRRRIMMLAMTLRMLGRFSEFLWIETGKIFFECHSFKLG
jgi:hypothetical protein